MTAKKMPPKLSPQEDRVFKALLFAKSADVLQLYRIARATTYKQADRVPHRRRQQHVGVLVMRINKKRRKHVIVPGDRPRTYKLTRRR